MTSPLATAATPCSVVSSSSTATSVCPSFAASCPKFKPIVLGSLYCAPCTHLFLCAKYSFPRSFGDRCGPPRIPVGCSREEVVSDLKLIEKTPRWHAKIQSLLSTKWPPSLPPVIPSLVDAASSSSPSVATSPPVEFPASSVSTLAPYDQKECDSVCPLCVYKPPNKKKEDARKTLSKHVNEKHRFCDPRNPRFVEWLAASKRFFCPGCGLSPTTRQAHDCPGPPPTHPVSPPAPTLDSPIVGASSEEVKVVAPTCVPELMEILATSIPSVKRIPQQCRVAVAKAYTTSMRNCSVIGTKEQEMRAWKLQFMFPKCVLRLQPDIRGGKKKKL